MEQTKITDKNMQDFYKSVYKVQTLPKTQLFDLSKYSNRSIVAIDSCGWYYQEHFPENHIIKIEELSTAKDFKLNKNQFDKIFNQIGNIHHYQNCILLLDYCPKLFKYKNVSELSEILNLLTSNTLAEICLVRMNITTLNDNRFVDRFVSLSKIIPNNYVVVRFEYNIRDLLFEIKQKI